MTTLKKVLLISCPVVLSASGISIYYFGKSINKEDSLKNLEDESYFEDELPDFDKISTESLERIVIKGDGYNFSFEELSIDDQVFNEAVKKISGTERPDVIYDSSSIFPDLDKEYIYNLIRIKDGRAIITNDMVAQIIKYIVIGLSNTDGDVEFRVKKISDQEMYISSIWMLNNQVATKTYHLKIF